MIQAADRSNCGISMARLSIHSAGLLGLISSAWGLKAEPVYRSPLRLLMHPKWGLWHSYRGALERRRQFELDPHEDGPNPPTGARNSRASLLARSPPSHRAPLQSRCLPAIRAGRWRGMSGEGMCRAPRLPNRAGEAVLRGASHIPHAVGSHESARPSGSALSTIGMGGSCASGRYP